MGRIFPAMANPVMMFEVLGYPASDPRVATARRAVDKLLVAKGDEIYCQPCFSPVWDTGLVCHALLEVGSPKAVDCVLAGLQWLKPLQVLDAAGDWADQRPDVRPGGGALPYAHSHHPRLHDTPMGGHGLEPATSQSAPPRQ